ncbi:MAG: RecX family transcriptional regulator [Clostridia bacterium]|nr:RecX family transcriptional regulator [Clostridia bacterium]
MIITSITPTDENGKREIYIDEELFATLGADIVMSLDLHTGDELDEAALEELIARAEGLRAIQKAYTYLSYQALSRKKLGEKLQKAGFSEAAVAVAMERLEELGLVNDEVLARQLKDVMERNKHWGPRRRAQELYKRGITPPPDEQEAGDEREHIRYHLEHKYRKKDLSDPDERRRVAAGLARLGFSFEDIRAVMGEYTDTEDFE